MIELVPPPFPGTADERDSPLQYRAGYNLLVSELSKAVDANPVCVFTPDLLRLLEDAEDLLLGQTAPHRVPKLKYIKGGRIYGEVNWNCQKD